MRPSILSLPRDCAGRELTHPANPLLINILSRERLDLPVEPYNVFVVLIRGLHELTNRLGNLRHAVRLGLSHYPTLTRQLFKSALMIGRSQQLSFTSIESDNIGSTGSAWDFFREAQNADPDDPNLALLEVTLLTAE